jgi:hypothetical protein
MLPKKIGENSTRTKKRRRRSIWPITTLAKTSSRKVLQQKKRHISSKKRDTYVGEKCGRNWCACQANRWKKRHTAVDEKVDAVKEKVKMGNLGEKLQVQLHKQLRKYKGPVLRGILNVGTIYAKLYIEVSLGLRSKNVQGCRHPHR